MNFLPPSLVILIDLGLLSHLSAEHKSDNSDPEIERNQLYQVNDHTSTKPDGIHPRVLRERMLEQDPYCSLTKGLESLCRFLLTGSYSMLFQSTKDLISVLGKIIKVALSTIERYLRNNGTNQASEHSSQRINPV